METEAISIWMKELLAVALLVPLVWYFVRTNQKNVETNLKTVTKGFSDITEALVIHMDDDKVQFEKIVKKVGNISKSIGKTSLSNEQIVSIAKSRVWYASEKKLDFIKKRLKKNNLKEREEIIRKQIRTELDRISIDYIDELNWYTSSLGLVGDWVGENFPMEDFMEEIFDVVFSPRKEGYTVEKCIASKIDDCSYVMKSYQMTLWEEMKKKLN